jgi:membrane dipeptidase
VTHILHILKVAGPDHVGFGADWDGGGGVIGLEDVSQLPKITDRLLQAGYTEQQIANIWGGNLLRVIRQTQALAESPPPTDRTPTR